MDGIFKGTTVDIGWFLRGPPSIRKGLAKKCYSYVLYLCRTYDRARVT